MPFKSEAQRKYLWANEPEIARDWTDTYGSGIQAAQGGRIGFYRGSPHSSGRGPGPGGQSSASNRGRDPGPGVGGQSGDRGGSLSTGSPHSGSWSGPTYSPPEQLTVTRPSQHIGAGDITQNYNKNLRNLQRQQQYQQGAYQRAHPFLSKVRSGLGSLGRGIGQVARNVPLSLGFDNKLMKLLAARYGGTNIKDFFQRNNQDDEEIDYNQLGLYTDRIGDAIGPGKRVGEDINVQETILPEDRPTDSLMDERTLMADLSANDIKLINYAKKHGLTTPTEIRETVGASFNKEKPPTNEEIEGVIDKTITEPTGKFAAEGGLIGSVGGISRPKYQQGNMVGAEMEGAEMQSQEVIKELYDALIAQGLSPQEAMEKIKEIIASTQSEGPQSPMMGEEFPGQEFGRAPAAFGGIMDTYTGRRKYGLGSFIKKAVGKIKKIAKSPIGKAALLGGLGYMLTPGAAGMGSFNPAGKGAFWKNVLLGKETGIVPNPGERVGGVLNMLKNPWVSIPAAATVAGLYTAQQPEEDLDDSMSEWKRQKADMDRYLANLGSFEGGDYRVPSNLRLAQGGRIGYGLGSWVKGALGLGKKEGSAEAHPGVVAPKDPEVLRERLLDYFKAKMSGEDYAVPGMAEGGLMNLGGMEKDYRNDGGFVPLGGEEKADDVPARLSRNEFVFTADAVRNAGGGDIDAGAEVMENVMKNLEGGGKISEESQGQGAQEMFETSERLSEVV
jgi:hypothetical protein